MDLEQRDQQIASLKKKLADKDHEINVKIRLSRKIFFVKFSFSLEITRK